ncbi:hypothetical protein ACSIFQ_004712 [Enterobacter hormaechei]|uniref:hypothetical protein n=1 Tax=Enterobacter hormaechei TaxID=158836 RepID=UPI003ED27D41
MKLIDVLVDELPKRGGWPGAIHALAQNSSGYVYQPGGFEYIYRLELADDWMNTEVTCEKYFDALIALKPVWDGEGLPPVGCECEYKDTGTGEWMPVEIKYLSSQIIVFSGRIRFRESAVEISKDVVIDNPQFRPIRSEADKKRDAAISAIDAACLLVRDASKTAKAIYDAIAAGDIPGVKIE